MIGRDLAVALCHAAGIDPTVATELTLTLTVGQLPWLEVGCLAIVDPDDERHLIEMVGRYELVPREATS